MPLESSANLPPIIEHGVMRARWRPFFGHLDGRQTERDAGFPLGQQRLATNELRLVQIDENRETGFKRRMGGREVGAIERVTHFKAQGIACAEAARLDAILGTALEDAVPLRRGFRGGKKQLKTLLAGVPGARDDELDALSGDLPNLVAARSRCAEQLVEKPGSLRALEGDTNKIGATIGQLDGLDAGRARIEPSGIQEKSSSTFEALTMSRNSLVPKAVNDEIIDDPAVVIEEESVMAMARREACDVVGQQSVKPRSGSRAAGDELPHMGNIEEAGIAPDSEVLIDNAAVLDRHEPVAKFDHLRAEAKVFLVERGCFKGRGG